MNYFEKYLKYKNKYLNLKNQSGGISTTAITAIPGKNYINVNGLPSSVQTYKDHLLRYLQLNNSKVTSIYCPSSNKCSINFVDEATALAELKTISGLIAAYDQSRTYSTASSSSSVVSAGIRAPILPQTKYYEPWATKNSKSLFVALVISPKTQVGTEIYRRLNTMRLVGQNDKQMYSTYNPRTNTYRPSGFLLDPHLTLFSLAIPEKGTIDTMLKSNLNLIVDDIKTIYNTDMAESAKQLYSAMGNYAQMGDWITRNYTDDDRRINQFSKTNFSDFLRNVKQTIFSYERIKEKDIVESTDHDHKRAPSIPKAKIPKFTHIYSAHGAPDTENSYMAISSFTTDFKPHISIANVNKLEGMNVDTFIDNFKKASPVPPSPGTALSFLNLWSDSTTHGKFPGNISHIYVSYDKQHIYVPV